MENNANYSVLARHYDLIVGDREDRLTVLADSIRKWSPEGHSLLELACGTGLVLEHLGTEYDLHGLDLSPDMVEVASRRVPDVNVWADDMTQFELDRTFDIILCVYDSINHLLDWELWKKTIERAATHLRTGGVFAFDLNTPERHAYMAAQPARVRDLADGRVMTMRASVDREFFHWDIQVFVREGDGRYRLDSERVSETSYDLSKVLDELENYFVVRELTSDSDTPRGHPNWRPLIICSKK